MPETVNLQRLLSQMTLEEKVGQLAQFDTAVFMRSGAALTGPEAEKAPAARLLRTAGSVLNFRGGKEARRIQEMHLKMDRNKIPLLLMMDVVHGYRTVYPIPLAMGASFDPALMAQCAEMAAGEATAGGVHVTFAPMVDYVRDARWGRVMETCGEDVYLNGVMGAAQVKAFQGGDLKDKRHVASCVKHYAGYGGAEAGRDYNTVEISERTLRQHYLPAYKDCLDAGARLIMPSFNSLNGIPSVANPWLMKRILRDEWGFEGVAISDYNGVGELVAHGVAEDKREAAALAFENGCHMDMCAGAYTDHLAELVREGRFPEAQLDEYVLRVLRLKEELGLFEDPFRGLDTENEESCYLTPENRALARRAAEETAVLLKNDDALPLTQNIKSLALIGPYAASHEIKGFWAFDGRDEDCVPIKDGLEALLPDTQITACAGCSAYYGHDDEADIESAVETAKTAEKAILCLGEPQDYSGEGKSRAHLTLPGRQMELAKAVLKERPDTVVVVFGGRPLVLTELETLAPAMLMMWYPGTEGGNAAARLLLGLANPCGKVPMSFPKAEGQVPLYYDHPSTGRPKKNTDDEYLPFVSNYIDCGNLPLYSFGHGLSYTNFSYKTLELDKKEMGKGDTLTVTVTVKNTGSRPGKETVQLYLRDKVASVVRPVQQLIGFEKVLLQPGEEKKITFTVTESRLRFWNFENQWVSEPGEFEVSTGYADHLILTQAFRLTEGTNIQEGK